MKECYYKKGASVIYHYREWRRVYWGPTGYGWVDCWKRATMACSPRDENGRFTNDENEMFFFRLKDEKGNQFNATISEVEPDRKVTALTREELIKLWKEIRRGSLYYKDYSNSLSVFEERAHDVYEGFLAHLMSEYEDGRIELHDTAEEFADYVEGYLEDY